MIIRPSDGMGLQALLAAGTFSETDGAFVINKLGGETPLGGTLCTLGSGYSVSISPDGAGRSLYGASELTPMDGAGKASYIRDVESGDVWSIAFSPAGERNRDIQIEYLPGRAVIRSLNHKIGAEITVAAVHDKPCEIWHVRLENRSARHRALSFTTYIKLSSSAGLETRFLAGERALIARKSLGALGSGDSDAGRDLVLFHASTLNPSAFEIERGDFIGKGGTLRSPRKLSEERSGGRDGAAENAIMSLTVNADLPIEGEAQIAFCFGACESVEDALETVRSLNRIGDAAEALRQCGLHWPSISSTLTVKTPDPVLNALVNTWLPYETYAGWVARRTGGVILDASQVTDSLRRYYPVISAVPEQCWSNLISFSARLSSSGALAASENVRLAPSAEELLWLAASAAAYVAETGDSALLDERIQLTDGIVSTLGDECERAVRMCLNGDTGAEDSELLRRTVHLWNLIRPECRDIEWRGAVVGTGQPQDDRGNPGPTRRISYLQSVCPTLSDPVMEEVIAAIPADESQTGEVCSLYLGLVEHLFGVSASVQGLVLNPRLPASWHGFEMTRWFRGDTYHIRVSRSQDGRPGCSIMVDAEPIMGNTVPHFGDGGEHVVEVTTG